VRPKAEGRRFRLSSFGARGYGRARAGRLVRSHAPRHHVARFSGTTLSTLSPDLTAYDRTKSALHFDPERHLPVALVRKLLAEQAARNFVESLPEEARFELTTICPGLMCGPYLGGVPGTSAETTMRLLRRQTPAVPNMIFPAADVRDVATMHLATSLRPRWPAADDESVERLAWRRPTLRSAPAP
jgi:hypothetical protein